MSYQAFDISKKIRLTAKPSSYGLVLRVTASNWLMEELPGLNPDWFSEIKLFLVRMVNILS